MNTNFNNLKELLSFRAAHTGNKTVYTFLDNKLREEGQRTYRTLHNRAVTIAAFINTQVKDGECVLLLYPPGLDYLDAFWGTLYSSAIAVTAYPPSSKIVDERLAAIAGDCSPRLVLTTSAIAEYKAEVSRYIPELENINWICTDTLITNPLLEASGAEPADVAFLQYTSGSTSSPKGVMVTHQNILANEALICEAFGHDSSTVVVGWLPMYHDMGLIGNILQPIYAGASCYLMSPFTFLKRPMNWLEAISRYRAHTSGGPNFAYELVVNTAKPQDLNQLDLSCWRLAFNGAEPVRAATLDKFANFFKAAGFSAEAFYPCFGLAEATLFVCGSTRQQGYITLAVDKDAFADKSIVPSSAGDTLTLVGSGKITGQCQRVLIVDQEYKEVCADGTIGEIWVQGASVASGYWNKPEKSQEVFQAFTGDTQEGPFLRTGDLGFIKDGNLYVTGRSKELIIIHGRNYYPQDIEFLVESCDPALKKGCGAAFSIDYDNEEKLVIIQEVKNRVEPEKLEQILCQIRETINRKLGFDPYNILLVQSAAVPKTTSGKIQRLKCRELYLTGQLPVLHALTASVIEQRLGRSAADSVQANVETWLLEYISKRTGIPYAQLDLMRPLAYYGFDSIKSMQLAHEIEERFELEISPALFFESDTIHALLENLRKPLPQYRSEIKCPDFNAPLTPAQQRLWFIRSLAGQKQVAVITVEVEIDGLLDRQALQTALLWIHQTQHILQTCFSENEGEIVQKYNADIPLPYNEYDLTALPASGQTAAREELKQTQSSLVFDVAQGPCWQAALIRLAADKNFLLITLDHLIADGWSLNVFISELTRYYAQITDHSTLQPVSPPRQYTELCRNLPEPGNASLQYWKQRLTAAEPLELPVDFPRPVLQTFRGERFPINFSPADTAALKALAHNKGVTLFTVLLALYKVLLYRYTHQENLCVGTPVANRDSLAAGRLIGLFMDVLILYTKMENCTFAQLLNTLARNFREAMKHKHVSLIELLKEINPVRDASRSPFFQVLFIFQNAELRPHQSGSLTFYPRQVDNKSARFELTLELYEGAGGVEGWFEYNTDLFAPETIRRMADQFISLSRSALANPETSIEELNIHSPALWKELISDVNCRERDYAPFIPVHNLFEAQAALHPQRIALVFQDKEITYQELNTQANIIANRLLEKNKPENTFETRLYPENQNKNNPTELSDLPDSPPFTQYSVSGNGKKRFVGIYLHRSVELVATVLGVLKAGLAYIPLDPLFPVDRIKYVIADAGLDLVVSNSELAPDLNGAVPQIIWLDGMLGKQEPISNPELSVNPEMAAYVLYTSGSTGNPKGVEIGQEALTNFLRSMQEKPGIAAEDRLLAVTTLAFDISMLEIFLPLISGAQIILAAKEDIYSGAALSQLISRHKATFFQATPATWKMLIEAGWQGAPLKALCGGEALSLSLAHEIRKRTSSLWNMYGPTETTIWSTVSEIQDMATYVSLGEPIANTELYIVDKAGRIAALGVPGELCIGGKGLAHGYLNRPELTAEKFITLVVEGSQVKVYKTGDLVRYNPAHYLEYLGRIDNQVKIRGYRIELGEIEVAIRDYKGVEDCVVSVKELRQDEKTLVAYVIGNSVKLPEVKRYLESRLPLYMVPSFWVPLDKFPLTANGKLDRKKLPLPTNEQKNMQAAATQPTGKTETRLREIWTALLEKDSIGLTDNFFDLGGHSLLLGKLHAKIEKEFNLNFELIKLFSLPTIADQAAFINGQKSQMTAAPAESKMEEEPVAIVGISCRVPGARSKEEFWQNLIRGVESIARFTKEELAAAGVNSNLSDDPAYVNAWGTLTDVENFDAAFFGYTPREAELIDPQQRIFLEECYRALEDSGYSGKTGTYAIGVFAGTGMNDYLDGFKDEADGGKTATAYQHMISNDKDFIATRVAYKLNLTGPAMGIQTACSTSLVAVHLACRSLLQREADMALAGGVSIRLPQKRGYYYQEGMILSPDGHCRAFDAQAQGVVGGNGAGVVVLKRLSDAIRDRDNIYAVIKGSAINNDGLQKIGYTAPSMEGQTKVVKRAMEKARFHHESISFIENHGTGTNLGDQIEIAALKQVFGESNRKQYCALGSVKTNIGHLDSASGVAGLIKSALALKHGMIPPSLNYTKPNPKLGLEDSPFYVNTELKKWKPDQGVMRCGVSSFGIGGTNAHVVMEQYLQNEEKESTELEIIPLSAHSAETLTKQAEQLAHQMFTLTENNSEVTLSDVAWTLQEKRRSFAHRRIFTAGAISEVANRANDAANGYSAVCGEKAENLVFLFPGQGAQYPTMGRELYKKESGFRRILDNCAALFKKHGNLDIIKILYHEVEEGIQSPNGDINATQFTQPLLFAVEYALGAYLLSLGLSPAAMLGHSLGEYVCACLAGVFCLEDAVKLILFRARLIASLKPGAMLAVFAEETQLSGFLNDELSLAVVNASNNIVLSGTISAVEKLKQQLTAVNILFKELKTSHAFHSVMLEPILPEFTAYLEKLEMHNPQIPYVSNVTGTWIKATEATNPAYWTTHLRHTVRFASGLDTLKTLEEPLYVEAGPGLTLTKMVQTKNPGRTVFSTLVPPKENISEHEKFLTTLGALWCRGQNVDWKQRNPGKKHTTVSLPPYPFSGSKYWKGSHAARTARNLTSDMRNPVAEWFYVPTWKRSPLLPVTSAEPVVDILIFADEHGIGAALAAAYRARGIRVKSVASGNTFAHTPEGYTLEPGNETHYQALFQDLEAGQTWPGLVLHCWNINISKNPSELEEYAFYSLVYLIKSLGQNSTEHKTDLVVLSSDTHLVTGSEDVYPQKSLLRGPVRVGGQEYPNLQCRNIDLTAADYQSPASISAKLIKELACASQDQFVAYRGIYRWVSDFSSIRIPQQAQPAFEFKKDGVYVITGGTGGLGLLFARFIAAQTQVKLALISRSDVTSRQDELTGRLKALEELGSHVRVLQADITDCTRLSASLDQVEAEWGRINGIIHAAGIAGDGLMQFKTRERASQVLAPKVQGTLNLEVCLAGRVPDFLLLFSSVTAFYGGIGQVDYCSANAFLDTFALIRREYPVFVINWDTWKETGMAAVRDQVEAKSTDAIYPAGEKADFHPLFNGRYQAAENRELFYGELSADHWLLAEHKIGGVPTLPGSAYVQLVTLALSRKHPDWQPQFSQLDFLTPLVLHTGETRQIVLEFISHGNGYLFQIHSRRPENREQTIHASGMVTPILEKTDICYSIEAWKEACNTEEYSNPVELAALAGAAAEGAEKAIEFGTRWQNISNIKLGNLGGLARMQLADACEQDLAAYPLHPALLDCAVAFPRLFKTGQIFLPLSYKNLKVYRPLPSVFYSYIRYADDTLSGQKGDLLILQATLVDEAGNLLASVDEFVMRKFKGPIEKKVQAGRVHTANDPVTLFRRQLRDEGITDKEGLQAFTMAIQSGQPQVIVSTYDCRYRLTQYDSMQLTTNKVQAAEMHPRPELKNAYIAPTTELEKQLADIWQRLLGIRGIGRQDDFFELGADSLLLVEFHKELKTITTVNLPVVDLYKYKTIEELALRLNNEGTETAQKDMQQILNRVELKKNALLKKKAKFVK